jgi:hypothetical protein
MFSKAYIKISRKQGGAHLNKFQSQSLKVICVGKCPKSDSLLFYHPPSQQLISDADGHRFDNFSPSGPQFGLQYDGAFVLTRKSDQPIHQSPAHEEQSTAYVNRGNKYEKITVLSVPINDEDDNYTVQAQESGHIFEVSHADITNSDPTKQSTDAAEPLNNMYPWIKNNAKTTVFLSDTWTRPKQGFLTQQDEEWYFSPGRTKTTTPIHLPNFVELAESMIHNKKLFRGWKTAASIINARTSRCLSNIAASLITARHVSAVDLVNTNSPTSLIQHAKMHLNDKKIWDQSYFEEYDGLVNLDTWEVISEDEYKQIKHLVKRTLPTMAIATIKKDGQGNPIRAKYRIVALGNLDPHEWSKQDCFAPVMSQQELRLMISLAARNKCIPKTGDVSQAFCQSYLPKDEVYVCRPPSGCPITPPNSYWRLRKTLYGLKRSPRHWYHLAKTTLLKIGLKQCPHSPCLFTGVLIEGEPPIYLGLYVDDFVYFSQSKLVENKFETSFATHVKVTFQKEIDYFLGIKFTSKRHKDGHVTIKMSQKAYIEELLHTYGLTDEAINTPKSPYRSGYPVDSIPNIDYDTITQQRLTIKMQSIVGCLNWLSVSTRPDIATITSILAQYCRNPSQGHIDSATRVLKYLKGTKDLKIQFSSRISQTLQSFIKFPPPPGLSNLCDANWGPQDQSKPMPGQVLPELDLFKTRSMSGYITWLGGPIMWASKRQTFTARSSAEAEIYATDECAKNLLHLMNIIKDLGLDAELLRDPVPIWNDNNACVCWSKNTTTKGLRHVQIRENAVREGVSQKLFTVKHIAGKHNSSDIFTKEDKDIEHYLDARDSLMCDSDRIKINDNESATQLEHAPQDAPSTGGCHVGST